MKGLPEWIDRPDLAYEIGREQVVDEMVYALVELLAETAVPMWHQGDGMGGIVLEWLWEAAEARGLPTPYTVAAARRPSTPARKTIPPRVAARVFARDGLQCRDCSTEDNLTIDHIVPVSKGGGNEFDNLQTLCRSCNSRKGAK